MSNATKKDIVADKVFDTNVKEHVEKKHRNTFCIAMRGGQAVFSGDEEAVSFATENMTHMTVEELAGAMKTMTDVAKYKTTEVLHFPPISVKFKGRYWTHEKARSQLSIYMNILGFGKGGAKKYKKAGDEPSGWPDEHSFVDFHHPSYAKIDTINDIIAGILDFHGFNVANHHVGDAKEEEPPRKRRRVKPTQDDPADDFIDENDNSFAEEGGDVLESDEDSPESEQVLSPYLQLRQNNIRERKIMEKELGIIPHSEEAI